MKRTAKHLSLLLVLTMVIAMIPVAPSFATAKKPGKAKIKKVTVASANVSKPKITVNYKKAKNAKTYKLYRVTSKQTWMYWKTVKAAQKKKYTNKNKYKLVKKGGEYKVYQKKNKLVYKKLAASKKTSMSFTGNWNTSYKLVVRAYNGKKAGAYSASKSVRTGSMPVANSNPIKKAETSPATPTPSSDNDKFETYVFFGSDSRANDESWKSSEGGKIENDTSGTSGVPRSDVILLINVNRSKKTIDLVSIYRDTALNKGIIKEGDIDLQEINFQKANKAYADYGPKEACKVLENNLDIKITGYAATTFKGVADIIDGMGKKVSVSGLMMETDADEYKEKGWLTVTDTANMYLDEMNSKYGRTEPYIKEGIDGQELTGLQAVAYARVRYTEGGDIERTERQRHVLKEMIKNYNTLNDVEKIKLIVDTGKNIEVGFLDGKNLEELSRLAELIKDVSQYTINSSGGFPYYFTAETWKSEEEPKGKSALLIPTTFDNNITKYSFSDNVTKLHKEIYLESGYTPSDNIKKFDKEIIEQREEKRE